MYKNIDTKRSVSSTVRSFVLERGVRRQVLLGLLFACAAGVASVGLVGLAGWFIAASALAGISGGAAFIVAYPSSGIRAFAVARVISRYLERLINHRVTFSLLSRLRVHFFERALRISPERFGRYRSGDLLVRATSDIDALDNVFPRVIVPSIAAFVVCTGSVAFVAYYSLLLAIILSLGIVASGLALPFVSSLIGRGSGVEIARSRSVLRTEMVEAVEGLPEVRSYMAGDIVAARLRKATAAAARDECRARLADAAGTSFGTLAAQATVLSILVAGIYSYQVAGLAGPIVALAVLLATGVFEQLGTLPAAYRSLGVTRAAASRLSEIFASDTAEAGLDGNESRTHERKSDVVLDLISLRYEGRESPALSDFSLRAGAGEVTALVGKSGAGKTTVLKLIAGELAPESGTVTVGGESIGDIAYASQDEHIFDATLRENLKIAAPEATDDVLRYVLDSVALSGFLGGLEDGLDTRVGEHGREISGGQRRRIATARAMLRRPGVLLLDEPTGSLDDETATDMIHNIRQNLPHSTIIIATHDPRLITAVIPETNIVGLS